MSDHYEGWGEHHAYRCGRDDGFDNGYFAGVEACIAFVLAYAEERLIITEHPNASEDITAALRVAAARLREVQP